MNNNFVTPYKQQNKTPPDLTEYAHTNHTLDLQVYEGAKEQTDSVKRSYGLLIRFIPITVVWLVLSFAIIGLVGWPKSVALILFSITTGITYAVLDRQEKEYSTNGIEIRKINAISRIKERELDYTYELKRLAIKETVKLLSKDNE